MHERIRSVLAERHGARRTLRRSGSRPLFVDRRARACAVQGADGAIHRARQAQRRRSSTSSGRRCSTSRRRSCRLPGVRARDRVRARSQAQVAGAASRAASAARSCTSAATPRSGSIATSSGFPANGPSCTGCSRSRTSMQIERQPVRADAERPPTTIEHEYLMALVLQLMNAGNMTARADRVGRGRARRLVRAAAAVARAVARRRRSTSISRSREGLKRRTPAPLEGRVLFLDTRPLHALLMQNVVMLEQKIARDSRAPTNEARAASSSRCSRKLAAQVDPEFKPLRAPRRAHAGDGQRRRDRRLRQDRRVTCARRSAIPTSTAIAGKSFGGTMELAVFGRMRNESDRRVELARRRLAQYAAPGGPWEVKDVSSDRLPAGRADERRAGRRHARHAGGDPAARQDATGRSASCGG